MAEQLPSLILEGEIVELREFVCKHCGHSVVVKPNLPKDYTPNVCSVCWDNIVVPKHEAWKRNIAQKLMELQRLLTGEGR